MNQRRGIVSFHSAIAWPKSMHAFTHQAVSWAFIPLGTILQAPLRLCVPQYWRIMLFYQCLWPCVALVNLFRCCVGPVGAAIGERCWLLNSLWMQALRMPPALIVCIHAKMQKKHVFSERMSTFWRPYGPENQLWMNKLSVRSDFRGCSAVQTFQHC